ncbi:MAG: hypothetical protein ACI4XN_04265 [Candidatus Kurthia intestinigallinarum]
MNKTMSIYAEALSDNREYKNARINGEAVGVANARAWANAVKSLRIPAYAIRVYRYNHMGDAETVAPCDQSALYDALRPVLEMVGEVNGAKLDTHNMAEEIISNAMRFRTIDTSEEMAHAHLERRLAKKALTEDETEENQAEYDKWNDECKRLEGLPGNCKRIAEIQPETAFVKAVELLLGDAIRKQTAKSVDEVMAEEEAKKAARRAKNNARKRAQKAAAKKAA